MSETTAFDREREGYAQQAFTFYRYAVEARDEEVRGLWRSASGQMEMASKCNAPEGCAQYVSNAVRFARHAQALEAAPAVCPGANDCTGVRPGGTNERAAWRFLCMGCPRRKTETASAKAERAEEEERRRKAAQKITNEKREATLYAKLKAKREAKP